MTGWSGPAASGRGACSHRGRSPLGGSPGPGEREALGRAMERLLALGGVTARRGVVEVGGARLHYLEAGEGPPLALVQGAGGGAANWFRVMGSLSRRFRVVALDLPGFGFSEPVDPVAPLGFRIAAVVAAWLRTIDAAPCDVVGTSFGGLIALRLVQQDPEMIRRLVLLDAAGLGRDLPAIVRLAAVPALGRWVLHPSRRGTRWVFRHLMTSNRSRIDPRIEESLVEYLWRSEEASDRAMVARAYRLFCGLRGQREVLTDAELTALALPVLVLWGAWDRFLPLAHAERAAARIPGARLRVIQGAGHSPNWEAPAEVEAAVVEFLRRPEGVFP